MSIRAILSAFVLLVAIVCVSTWTNAQNDVASSNDKVQQLLIERRDTLQERLDAIEASFKSGATERNVVIRAEIDVLDVKLELATQPAERIAILEEVVSSMRRIEEATRQRFESGTALQQDVLLAKAERLQAEINLLRARGVGN